MPPDDVADVADVPAAGTAHRVVLLGESTARGWPYDPGFNPASALRRQLAGAGVGSFECVDLAKTGANAADLIRIARQLPLLAPDVIVSFAGNNWALLPEELEPRDGRETAEQLRAEVDLRDALAAGLRHGGYPGLRQTFLDRVVVPRAREYLDLIVEAQRTCGASVVMVIPEFNLRGWVPPADVEVPALPKAASARWYGLRAAARGALTRGAYTDVIHASNAMAEIDGGLSPVPGYLLGLAATALGDGGAARDGFERSRDAVCGLFVRHTPRCVTAVQDLLVSYATTHGWACVDLRTVLRAADLPRLPDVEAFHDYCHLSDMGIERAAGAIADAILRQPIGTAAPGPGVGIAERGFAEARAAAHLAYQAQPVGVVATRLRAALATLPALRGLLQDAHDVLAAPRPAWTHPAVVRLADNPDVWPFISALAGQAGLTAELWTLREALQEVLGLDASECATKDAAYEMDLLAAPEPDGHPLPNWTASRGHHHATAQTSALGFAIAHPATGFTLALTYRTSAETGVPAGTVHCGKTWLGELPCTPRWSALRLPVPAAALRPGVNWIRVLWPTVPADPDAQLVDDAAAFVRGALPYVLPRYGELYEARLRFG